MLPFIYLSTHLARRL